MYSRKKNYKTHEIPQQCYFKAGDTQFNNIRQLKWLAVRLGMCSALNSQIFHERVVRNSMPWTHITSEVKLTRQWICKISIYTMTGFFFTVFPHTPVKSGPYMIRALVIWVGFTGHFAIPVLLITISKYSFSVGYQNIDCTLRYRLDFFTPLLANTSK